MANPKVFVLDTSALLALRGNERGADHVEHVLLEAKERRCRVLLSFMTRMELLYLIHREEGEKAAQEAIRLVDSFVVEWVSCEPEILAVAASLKSRGRLSIADSWIAATALARSAVLVHRDPEFTPLREISQDFLAARP